MTGNHEGYVGGFEIRCSQGSPSLNIKVLDNAAADLQGINLIGVSDMQSPAAKALAIDVFYTGLTVSTSCWCISPRSGKRRPARLT